MALTAKQISDLNNSMSAAQNVNLGTIIAQLAATGTITSGSVQPISGSECVVPTGILTSIAGFSVTFSGSPTANQSIVSGCVVGTNLNIKGWSGGDLSGSVVPTISSGSNLALLQWMAVGAD